MSPSRRDLNTTARLAIIRIALLAGVLTFAGMTWYMRRTGTPPAFDSDMPALRATGVVIWAVVIIGTGVLFARLRNTSDPARRAAGSIVGWALGETAALFGGVWYFLTGEPQWFLVGLTALLLTFFIFPARPPSPPGTAR